jgi:hypothetical protein
MRGEGARIESASWQLRTRPTTMIHPPSPATAKIQPKLCLKSPSGLAGAGAMLVPKFHISQTEAHVLLSIRVPYVRVGDAEIAVVSGRVCCVCAIPGRQGTHWLHPLLITIYEPLV